MTSELNRYYSYVINGRSREWFLNALGRDEMSKSADLIKRLRDCADQATKVGDKLENDGDRTGMEIFSVSFFDAADALEDQAAEIARLQKLVENAFNEGFGEGMKDIQRHSGGKGWYDSRARAKLVEEFPNADR
jgi:hypothetical protein